MADEPLLQVSGLTLDFPREYGSIGLLDSVSLTVDAGECVGVVGESGSGKSLLGLTILGLQSPAATVSGSIRFNGEEILNLPEQRMRTLRRNGLSVVYQDALTSLNPTAKIRNQLEQAGGKDARMSPGDLLAAVRIRDVQRCLNSYSFELSGGQRQRVLIALAIARSPKLIVADEPTTALDVTVQSQIVELLSDLRQEFQFGLLFIAHDLGLLSTIADRVVCMYAGQAVEIGPASEMFAHPSHPYMDGLLCSSRSLQEGARPLHQIPGTVPTPDDFGAGCRFASRCGRAIEECSTTPPPLARREGGRSLACFNPVPLSQGVTT